jgi:Divergent InlB B-repeat domain
MVVLTISFLTSTDEIFRESSSVSNNINLGSSTDRNSNNTITFEINPPNAGNIYCGDQKISNFAKTYKNGTELNCQAIADNDYSFSFWSGLATNSTNTIMFKVFKSGKLMANFSKNWYVGLSNPFILLIAGAMISGLLVPFFTNRWQNTQKNYELQIARNQKALELKMDLIDQMTKSVSTIVMSVLLLAGGIAKTGKEGAFEKIDTYKNWEISSKAIGSQLRAFFPENLEIEMKWNRFYDLINDFYALAFSTSMEMRILYRDRLQNNPFYTSQKTVNWDELVNANAGVRVRSLQDLGEKLIEENKNIMKEVIEINISAPGFG